MRNWAGSHEYRARVVHRPETLEGVQEAVAAAPRIRALGSRHSFSDIGDSDELVSVDGLPPEVAVDHAAGTVAFAAGLRYGELAVALNAEGLALHNLASLPHISVAGAVATATHGSGDRNGNLATAVAGLELVTAAGEVVTATRGDRDFDGLVVGLGALGVVTRIALDVEPAYQVRQDVFENLSYKALLEHFDEIMARGDSVSVFTRWGGTFDVWVKSRGAAEPARTLAGAAAATAEHHPIAGMDPVHCTPQLGAPGLWSDRLPHFRMGFTPSSGAELQSEYLLPRRHAVAAIEAVAGLRALVAPALQVCEIRTVAADELWMSPQYRCDTVGLHFTWLRRREAVEQALDALEAALAPLEPRPHWGKLFRAGASELGPRYARRADFIALAERLDPRGAFRNEWLDARVLGS